MALEEIYENTETVFDNAITEDVSVVTTLGRLHDQLNINRISQLFTLLFEQNLPITSNEIFRTIFKRSEMPINISNNEQRVAGIDPSFLDKDYISNLTNNLVNVIGIIVDEILAQPYNANDMELEHRRGSLHVYFIASHYIFLHTVLCKIQAGLKCNAICYSHFMSYYISLASTLESQMREWGNTLNAHNNIGINSVTISISNLIKQNLFEYLLNNHRRLIPKITGVSYDDTMIFFRKVAEVVA